MKSYLIIFICVLVLMLNLSSTSSKKSESKKLTNSNELKRPDPSGEPLPNFWTTGTRPNFPIQMNKNYKKYHTRLATSHKYKDHTKDLLKKQRKPIKKTKITHRKKLRSKKH
jgi:hypothetical protein